MVHFRTMVNYLSQKSGFSWKALFWKFFVPTFVAFIGWGVIFAGLWQIMGVMRIE